MPAILCQRKSHGHPDAIITELGKKLTLFPAKVRIWLSWYRWICTIHSISHYIHLLVWPGMMLATQTRMILPGAAWSLRGPVWLVAAVVGLSQGPISRGHFGTGLDLFRDRLCLWAHHHSHGPCWGSLELKRHASMGMLVSLCPQVAEESQSSLWPGHCHLRLIWFNKWAKRWVFILGSRWVRQCQRSIPYTRSNICSCNQ